MTDKSKNYKLFLFICLLVVSLGIYLITLSICINSDFYFTWYSGKQIWKYHNLHTNPATHIDLVIQQWLYAVFVYLFHKIGLVGDISLVVIQDIILGILLYIFYKQYMGKKLSIMCAIASILCCFNYMINIRPQIITMIFIVSQILIVNQYKKTNNIKILFLLIPISILSANFHNALFLYHIYVMIPYMIDKIENKFKIDMKIIIASLGMLLCSLITPYGADGILLLYKTYKSNVFDYLAISEIAPIELVSFSGIQILIFIIILLYFIRKGYANKFLVFYGVTATLFMMTLSFRHQVLGVIVYMYIFSNKQVVTFLYNVINNLYVPKIILIILSIVSLFIGINTFIVGKGEVCSSVKYAYDCIETIDDIPKDSHIFNTMNTGPYLEYKGYTDIFIDTRPELYTKELCGIDYINKYLILTCGIDKNQTLYSAEDIRPMYEEYDYIMILKTDYLYVDLKTNENYTLHTEQNGFVIYKHK